MKKRHIEKITYRDYKCVTYEKCLQNAARFDQMLDCSACPNRYHKIPRPSDIYYEMLGEETLCCTRLLHAIFRPEAWYHAYDIRKTIESPPKPAQQDAPLGSVDWLG